MKNNRPEPHPPAGGDPDKEVPTESGWGKIRQRLEASRLAFERGFERAPEEKDKILKDRATELARETRERDARTQLHVVEFVLAMETYGIASGFIRDVFPLKTLTPIPSTPPFVVGVTNLRGEILSVVNLKKFFDLPDNGMTDLTKVIVLQSDTTEFGILVDSLVGARSIPEDEIQLALPTLTDVRGKYLKGVTKERVAILDAGKILSDERIIVHEEVEV